MTDRVDHMLATLPRGNLLDDRVWSERHRPLLWLLLAHIPGLLVVAVATSRLSVLLGAFVLAACGAQVIFWKKTERQQVAAHAYYATLYEGERAVVAQLRQAQTVKDELIGVVGHEFRTPLTSIQGFARTLDARWDRMDRETQQTCMQAIEREAKRMTRMVSNLLAASEDVSVSTDDRCVLRDVAATAVDDVMQLTPMAGRSIRVDIPTDHTLAVSRGAATQLLTNLLDNAMKFAAPDSKVRVSSRLEGDLAVVEVANVGAPISKADHERIFDAFVQADSSDTRRYGGMGVGLHIVRKIVDAYGGRVAVYSEGPLVIFRTWLPVAGAASPPPARRVLERLPVLDVNTAHAREHSHP